MEIRKGSSAAESAIRTTDEKTGKPYTADNLMLYQISLALIDGLFSDGLITAADRKKAYTIIAKKHGLSLDSIFSERT